MESRTIANPMRAVSTVIATVFTTENTVTRMEIDASTETGMVSEPSVPSLDGSIKAPSSNASPTLGDFEVRAPFSRDGSKNLMILLDTSIRVLGTKRNRAWVYPLVDGFGFGTIIIMDNDAHIKYKQI